MIGEQKQASFPTHDIARPHTARRTQIKILELNLETIYLPLYSTDLSSSDYHLFRNLDNFIQGKKSNSHQAVKMPFALSSVVALEASM